MIAKEQHESYAALITRRDDIIARMQAAFSAAWPTIATEIVSPDSLRSFTVIL